MYNLESYQSDVRSESYEFSKLAVSISAVLEIFGNCKCPTLAQFFSSLHFDFGKIPRNSTSSMLNQLSIGTKNSPLGQPD